MNEFGLIAGMALVTFLIRYPLLALSGRIRLPEGWLRVLRYVPPAVLAAIVAPAVLLGDDGGLALGADNARLAGAVAALAVGVWRGSLLATIVAGMGVFLVWSWVWG
ncbi:MAG TPA: AzlD domain-containing protein [Candidatus Competibacteraceae bacterium]|nr:AzlD domain-containing protein [Candidatus Competibacteraceae bacterium]